MAQGNKNSQQETVGLGDLLVPLIEAVCLRMRFRGDRPDLDAVVEHLQDAANSYRLKLYSECATDDTPDGAVAKVKGAADRGCCRLRFGATASLRGGPPTTRSKRRTRK